jgi:hypothetical protein
MNKHLPIYKKNGSKIEPFIVGKGDVDYICGGCDSHSTMEMTQLTNRDEF